MKSLLPIDETWTNNTFSRTYDDSKSILQYNELPDTTPGANPFGTVAEQQQHLINYKAVQIPVPTDPEAYEDYQKELARQQIADIRSSLADDIKTVAMATLTPTQYRAYKVTGMLMGFLSIPERLVDTVTPIDANLQKELLSETVDTLHPQLTLRAMQDKVLNQLHKVEIPAQFSPKKRSEDNWYWKPRGEVMFQIEGEEPMEIPSWPDDINDRVNVSWSQEMTTYQHYEDQNTFKQSGPRTMDLLFKLHRAMWNGNQDSGDCEKLVAYMESACYPDYDTQACEPPRVLFTAGKSIRIYGIVTSFNAKYGGPIGPDTKYDCVDINISIKEESQNVLSTHAVRAGLAGWR